MEYQCDSTAPWGETFPDMELYKELDYTYPTECYRPERFVENENRLWPYPIRQLNDARECITGQVLGIGKKRRRTENLFRTLGIPEIISEDVYEHFEKNMPYSAISRPSTSGRNFTQKTGTHRYFDSDEDCDSIVEVINNKNKPTSFNGTMPEFISLSSTNNTRDVKIVPNVNMKKEVCIDLDTDSDDCLLMQNVKVLKCDYCPFGYEIEDQSQSSLLADMKDHLKKNVHYSASIFFALRSEKNPDGLEFTELFRRMFVRNNYAYMLTVLAICPQCFLIFENIFQCACHYRYFHDMNNSMYGLVNAKCTIVPTVTLKGSDCECGITFGTPSLLATHRARSGHVPFESQDANGNVYNCFIECAKESCAKNFQSYNEAKDHVLKFHAHLKTPRLRVRTFYGKKTESCFVPETFKLPKPEKPIARLTIDEQRKSDKSILKHLEKFHKKLTGYSAKPIMNVLQEKFTD